MNAQRVAPADAADPAQLRPGSPHRAAVVACPRDRCLFGRIRQHSDRYPGPDRRPARRGPLRACGQEAFERPFRHAPARTSVLAGSLGISAGRMRKAELIDAIRDCAVRSAQQCALARRRRVEHGRRRADEAGRGIRSAQRHRTVESGTRREDSPPAQGDGSVAAVGRPQQTPSQGQQGQQGGGPAEWP